MHHLGIVVNDLEESLHFYKDILEGNVTDKFYASKEDTDITYLKVGEESIELMSPRNAKVKTVDKKWENREITGVEHIAFEVDDIDETHNHLINRGVKCLLNPSIYGDIKFAYYQAPDDVILELVQTHI